MNPYQEMANILRRHTNLRTNTRLGYGFSKLLHAEGKSDVDITTIRYRDRTQITRRARKEVLLYLMRLDNLTNMGNYYRNFTARCLDGRIE